MYSKIAQFVTALLIFAALDAVWLGWLAGGFYEAHIGPDPTLYDPTGFDYYIIWIRWGALVIAYSLMALLVIYFVLPFAQLHHGGFFGRADAAHTPAQRSHYCQRRQRQEKANFLIGMKFGALVGGVYNFTNLSYLEEWDICLTLVDTAYSAVAYGVATAAVAAVGSAFDCLGTCKHTVVEDRVKIIETEIEQDTFVKDSDEIVVEEHVIDVVAPTAENVYVTPVRPVRPVRPTRIEEQDTIEEILVDDRTGNVTTVETEPVVYQNAEYAVPEVVENGSPYGIIGGETIETSYSTPIAETTGTEYVEPYNTEYTTDYSGADYGAEYVTPYTVTNRSVRPVTRRRRIINPALSDNIKSNKPLTHKGGRKLVRRIVSRKAR